MLADHGHLELGQMRLEYRMIGPRPDAAPTLVLLHEGLGCVAGWGSFAQELAAATGTGVFVYSRAGYGSSSPAKLPRPVSFMHEEALDVLARVLDAIGLRRGLLVGHSDGASIAAIYAGSVQDHRVRGLVLMDTSHGPPDTGREVLMPFSHAPFAPPNFGSSQRPRHHADEHGARRNATGEQRPGRHPCAQRQSVATAEAVTGL